MKGIFSLLYVQCDAMLEPDPAVIVTPTTLLQSLIRLLELCSMYCTAGYSISSAYLNDLLMEVLLFSDWQYRFSSSTLSVSSIRQQFSAKENVQLSLWSVGFLKNISTFLSVPGEDPPDVQFFEGGYLFLGSEKGRSIQKMNYELQR